jgi:hypothetical protein
MCHSYDARQWSRTTEENPDEPGEQDDEPSFLDDEPSFLDEEPAEDVELLTDGGDGN